MSVIINGLEYNVVKGYDEKLLSQTQAIITRAKNEGFTLPSNRVIYALNQHIKDLVNIGVWDAGDMYFNFAYNDTTLFNFSRINFKTPFDALALPVSSPTYTVSGWLGNGMDAYIDTQFKPDFTIGNFKIDNASIISTVYEAGGSTITGSLATNGNWLINGNATNHRLNSSGVINAAAQMSGAGMKGFMRDDANNVRFYNKDIESLRTQPGNTIVPTNQLVLRRITNYGLSNISNLLMGATFSIIQYQQIRNSYNKYLTAIGLQPIA